MAQVKYFCENCNALQKNEICNICNGETRKPQNGDLCYVVSTDEVGKAMYSEVLNGKGIEYLCVPVYSGYSLTNAPSEYRFYVKYAFVDTALSLYDVIWGDKFARITDCGDVIDRLVRVTVDRPLGSLHPEHGDIKYGLNYGYVDGVFGGDGEEQDAYVLGVNVPLPKGSHFDGYVIAVIRRKNDSETKWVVAPVCGGISARTPYTKEQIVQAVDFQEKFFDIEIIM